MMGLPDFQEKQIIFIFTDKGQKISFRNDNVIVRDIDGDIIHQSTCYRLMVIYIVGNLTVTSGLLQRSKKFGFILVLMNHSLKVYRSE
ncbi:MAG: hypothetical protein OXB88_00100, partial [Bacteriovoracales bacterium]|nr:hypothetical protein [Bacteriovoracales bacterium]